MKKIILIVMAVLLVMAASAFAETAGEESPRAGKLAAAGRLNLGKNDGDSIAQLGAGVEYGLIPHLSAGIGYVYIDGMHPLQASGLDVSVKGFLLDRVLDVYADLGSQLYFSDDFGAVFTLKAGAEWQSPFGVFAGVEGGAILEDSKFGYLMGVRAGYRF